MRSRLLGADRTGKPVERHARPLGGEMFGTRSPVQTPSGNRTCAQVSAEGGQARGGTRGWGWDGSGRWGPPVRPQISSQAPAHPETQVLGAFCKPSQTSLGSRGAARAGRRLPWEFATVQTSRLRPSGHARSGGITERVVPLPNRGGVLFCLLSCCHVRSACAVRSGAPGRSREEPRPGGPPPQGRVGSPLSGWI